MKSLRLPGLLTLATILFFSQPSFCQKGLVLKGKVVGNNGAALAVVTVLVKEKPNEATQTDGDGNFSQSVAEASGILVFSSVGYENKEVQFNTATTSFNVELNESVSVLNEVVLTGYITQKKSDITGAISSVRNKDFKDQPVLNLAQSIQGKVSGILVTSPSGTPGAGL